MGNEAAEIERLRHLVRVFGETQSRGHSAVYERLSAALASDDELLRLVLAAPADQRRPVLLFAAVNRLLADRPGSALAAYYPIHGGARPVDNGLEPAFFGFCVEHRDELGELLENGSTQTNEIRRCVALRLGLDHVRCHWPGPVALVEAGASAGLNLLFDHYRYRVGDHDWSGPAGSPVTIACEVRGEGVPLRPPPVITSRTGVDLSPVDVTDPGARAWLESFIWPEQTAELAMLRGAVALARSTGLTTVARGDAVNAVEPLIESLPGTEPVVVFTASLLSYLPAEARTAFAGQLRRAGSRRPVAWVFAEAPGLLAAAGLNVPALRGPLAGRNTRFVIGASLRGPGEAGHAALLARADSYLRWIAPARYPGDDFSWQEDLLTVPRCRQKGPRRCGRGSRGRTPANATESLWPAHIARRPGPVFRQKRAAKQKGGPAVARQRRKGRRVRGAVAAAVLAALAAAGCASGAGQGASPGQSGPAPVSVPSAPANPVTDYAQYTGGAKGKADPALKPVTLGLVNMQGGPPSESFPQATAAAQAAVKMINTELGGVHGHPVRLASCFVQSSESQGQLCGQQMANAGGVDAVVFGSLSIGNSSFYDAVKGKIPVIISVSENPVDDTAKNVFELEGSSTSASDVFGRFARLAYPKAKTAAIAYINNTGTQAISDGLRGSFRKAGFTVKMVPYSATATDLIGPATEMEQADIAVPACGFTDCPLMAKAISEIHGTKPAVSTPLWTYLPPQSYPGGDLPHWDVGEAGSNLAYPADPAVGTYLSKSAAYGLPKASALTVFAELTWSNVLVADKMMNEIPASKLTPKAVAAKLRQFRGTVPLGSPDTNCGGTVDAAAPAVCNVNAQFFRYEGKGKWIQAAGWLRP